MIFSRPVLFVDYAIVGHRRLLLSQCLILCDDFNQVAIGVFNHRFTIAIAGGPRRRDQNPLRGGAVCQRIDLFSAANGNRQVYPAGVVVIRRLRDKPRWSSAQWQCRRQS